MVLIVLEPRFLLPVAFPVAARSISVLMERIREWSFPGSEMSSTDLENAQPRSWRADILTLDIELAKPHEEDTFATDHYEILRLGQQADDETIERVYSTLAGRFHPDNPATGDPETFLRIREAYETLSDPARRARYNVLRQGAGGGARFRLRGREFFDGVRGEQRSQAGCRYVSSIASGSAPMKRRGLRSSIWN